MAISKDPIHPEVKEAFSFVREKLGLGRTIDFLFDKTSDNVQMAIMRTANEKEAPNEWHVEYNPEKITESMEFQEHSPSEYIRSLALHEILHLILWPLKTMGLKGLRKGDGARLIELEEAVVRMLESLLRPLVIKCRCSPKGRAKKSSPISTQLISIGQSRPIGDTPPSMIAPNPHATLGASSQESYTTPSGQGTEGESRSDTKPDEQQP